MMRHLALRSAFAAFVAALCCAPAAVWSFPAAEDTPYTFHVPLRLTDLNADTHRVPVAKIVVICAVSENPTAQFPPIDAKTGLPIGKSTDPSASMEIALPADGNLSKTADIVVKGTANERSYQCGMRFVLKDGTHPYPPSELNKAEAAGGSAGAPESGAAQNAAKVPNTKGGAPDTGHPFDDASLKVIVSGLFN